MFSKILRGTSGVLEAHPGTKAVPPKGFSPPPSGIKKQVSMRIVQGDGQPEEIRIAVGTLSTFLISVVIFSWRKKEGR